MNNNVNSLLIIFSDKDVLVNKAYSKKDNKFLSLIKIKKEMKKIKNKIINTFKNFFLSILEDLEK